MQRSQRGGVVMASGGELAPIDVAALAVLGIAALRGFGLGMLREAFSLASIAVAYLAVLLYSGRLAAWIERETDGETDQQQQDVHAPMVGETPDRSREGAARGSELKRVLLRWSA